MWSAVLALGYLFFVGVIFAVGIKIAVDPLTYKNRDQDQG